MVFSNVPLAAFAEPAALDVIASSLRATLGEAALNGSALTVTTITDVASGVEIFSGGGGGMRQRRLQQLGVKVDFKF